MNHRKPPLPEWYNERNPGICRWCGFQIFRRDGVPAWKLWHNRCVREFQFLFWPAVTVRELGKLRKWRCEDCGVVLRHGEQSTGAEGVVRRITVGGPTAEGHHIIPLIDYQHDPADPYAAWRETNLALLCHSCHMARHHPKKPIPAERQLRLY